MSQADRGDGHPSASFPLPWADPYILQLHRCAIGDEGTSQDTDDSDTRTDTASVGMAEPKNEVPPPIFDPKFDTLPDTDVTPQRWEEPIEPEEPHPRERP